MTFFLFITFLDIISEMLFWNGTRTILKSIFLKVNVFFLDKKISAF